MCKFKLPTIPAGATADERRSLMFNAMYSADLSEEIEKKSDLSYISWSQAWKVMKQFYPSATYTIHTNPTTGLPYFESALGIMVHTSVEADGITYENWLPVMDYANRSMKSQPYSVNVYDKQKRQYVEKRIEAATTFDCNSAIQRSLVKCMSMHGLGLFLYNGLDLPEDLTGESNGQVTETPTAHTSSVPAPMTPPQPVDRFAQIKNAINSKADINSLDNLYWEHEAEINGNPEIKAVFTQRRSQLQLLSQGRTA